MGGRKGGRQGGPRKYLGSEMCVSRFLESDLAAPCTTLQKEKLFSCLEEQCG